MESKLKDLSEKFFGTSFDVQGEEEIIKALEKELGKVKVDRVKDWEEFSKYMKNYIDSKTVKKYGQSSGLDLMSVTEPRICIWCILKYSLRLWSNTGKRYDLEKIMHYAQIAAKLSEGDLSKCGVRESENPNSEFWKNNGE